MKKIMFAALAALSACTTPTPEPSIEGAWRIEDVDGGGIIDSTRLEVAFAADGRVSGYTGCNAMSGPYTRHGGAIDMGPLASTRRACSAEALTLQETRVLRSLEAVTTLAFTPDGALVLSGPAPARLVLRRFDNAPADADAPLSVSGEVFLPDNAALPPGAIVRVTAQDVSRVDAAAPMLARVEAPAANGSPFAFTLDIPRAQLTPQSRIAVRAQILAGYAILFTSTEHYGVAADGPQAPLRIRVSPVADTGSGAGGHAVTPSPQTYVCGGETLRIAFEEGVAFLTFASGDLVRLARMRAAEGQDPGGPRLFGNGHFTLRQNIEGPEPRISFARGRAAFLACTLS